MAARLTAYLVVAIVVATVVAGLIVGAQRDDIDGPVDLIVQNATIYTADARGRTAEAVAIRGNRILSVGSNREIARLQRPQTVVVDARGGAVLPGFNDAHVRLLAGGLRLVSLDLAGAGTLDDLLDQVADWSSANPAAGWIVGRGWSHRLLGRSQPSRHVLDARVPDRPVALYDASGRSIWLNSAALRLTRIDRKTPDPPDGTIVRDSRRGEPTGVLSGAAVQLVEQVLPPPTREEQIAAVRAAVAEANTLGVTSVQSMEDSREGLEVYDALRRAGELTLRIYSAVGVSRPLAEPDLAALEEIRTRYPDDPLLKAGALYFRLDGGLGSREAATLEPYEDDPHPVEPAFTPDDLNRTARLADAAGWQIIAHAGGDRSARLALDAIAHAARSNRTPARGRRHRLDNLALIDNTDVPRFDTLDVVASMQPVRRQPSGTSGLARHLGEERAGRTYAFRSLGEETRLVFGSGWPAQDLNPLAGIQAAVKQTGSSTGTRESESEQLELEAAINAYTSAGAWASFDEQRKGSVSAGMLADLVVLDRNIFDQPASELTAASVAVTIFDGKVVYRRVPRSETAPVPSLQH